MKKISTIFLVLILLTACKEKTEEKPAEMTETTIFDRYYQNYTELDYLRDYQKVSDTIIYGEAYEPGFRLTELKKEGRNLVLFSTISLDEEGEENYKILDTLVFTDLQPNEFISVGYCQNEFIDDQQIISLVEETESQFVEKINRAWRANVETGEFEKLPVEGIECWNEHFQE